MTKRYKFAKGKGESMCECVCMCASVCVCECVHVCEHVRLCVRLCGCEWEMGGRVEVWNALLMEKV